MMIPKKCHHCGKDFLARYNVSKFCGRRCYFDYRISHREEYTPYWEGKKHHPETIQKFSDGRRKKENHPCWKGGVGGGRIQIRDSNEYKDWRLAVYERDNYTCCVCGRVGGHLNAHHICRFSTDTNKRLVIGNGMTLCEKCHRAEHRIQGINLAVAENRFYGEIHG